MHQRRPPLVYEQIRGTLFDANVENRAQMMPEAAETVQEILN
jgi:hypothetical protein